MTRLAFELATPADDADLRALLRATPMAGAIEVAFLREPSFFLACKPQGELCQVLIARDGERVVGVATRAVRTAFVDGEPRALGYLGDLRLLPEYRGTTAVARGYRFLRALHEDGRAELYTTVIVADNRAALSTIAANRADLPHYTDLGKVLTPIMYLRRPKPSLPGEIKCGSRDLLAEIVAKLNEHRQPFAPVYREEDFIGERFPGFKIEDFHVLYRRGRIVGVMATWDQSSFRQTVVMRYHGWLGRLRPLINLVRRPRLPDPGTRLRFFYLAFAATDDVEACRVLIRHIYNLHVGGDYTHFTLALHERDSRCAVFSDYAATPFAGRLFAVTFGEPPRLEDRVPWVEGALL